MEKEGGKEQKALQGYPHIHQPGLQRRQASAIGKWRSDVQSVVVQKIRMEKETQIRKTVERRNHRRHLHLSSPARHGGGDASYFL